MKEHGKEQIEHFFNVKPINLIRIFHHKASINDLIKDFFFSTTMLSKNY